MAFMVFNMLYRTWQLHIIFFGYMAMAFYWEKFNWNNIFSQPMLWMCVVGNSNHSKQKNHKLAQSDQSMWWFSKVFYKWNSAMQTHDEISTVYFDMILVNCNTSAIIYYNSSNKTQFSNFIIEKKKKKKQIDTSSKICDLNFCIIPLSYFHFNSFTFSRVLIHIYTLIGNSLFSNRNTVTQS